jgi:3-dehydroquinate dehydratase-2
MKIALINGPNLNLLGKREPAIYGSQSMAELLQSLRLKYPNCEIDYTQSNHEAELVEAVQRSDDQADALILNPAAFTHNSIALADAVAAIEIPCVEVHLSNIFKRESFRHHSYVSKSAVGVISGLGIKGYELALIYLMEALSHSD